MADFEAKLLQKEDALWKRGQAEIRKLQVQQQQVTENVSKLQERQATIISQNQEMQGALVAVTSQFEVIVKEMREVLLTMPRGACQPSPSPSVASTAASDAAKSKVVEDELHSEPLSEPAPGSGTAPEQLQTPAAALRNQNMESVDAEAIAQIPSQRTFSTPPRNFQAAEDPLLRDTTASGRGVAASPAVLSLASVLPAGTGAPLTPHPSPGLKQLHLAECLEQQQVPPMSTSRQDELVAYSTIGIPLAGQTKEFNFINVDLVKESSFLTLGIEVKQLDGVSLRVEVIDEHGLVGRYNSRQELPEQKVQVGDRIIEVNGVQHDLKLMLQECKVQQRIRFTIARDDGPLPEVSSDESKFLHPAGDDGAEAKKVSSAESKSSHPAGDDGAEAKKACSPLPTRLRPEATAFVPSSQKKPPMPAPPGLDGPPPVDGPPGFDGYDSSGLFAHPGSGLLTLPQYLPLAGVKRTLFS